MSRPNNYFCVTYLFEQLKKFTKLLLFSIEMAPSEKIIALNSMNFIEKLNLSDLDKKSDSVSEEKKKISEQMNKFNGKCESFSTAAEKIAKIVWGKDNRNYLEWRDKKNNLGNVHFLRISMRPRNREPYPGDP